MLFEFKKLAPIYSQENLINRSVCDVNDQPLVLFHKNGAALEPSAQHDWSKLLCRLGWGQVFEHQQTDQSWNTSSNFNCHTFAIGSRLGLTSNDWLEGISSSLTLGLNPAGLLLKRFFQPTISVQHSEEHGYESAQLVNENDVFVLYDSNSDRLVHSGLVKWIDDQPMAMSKFGEGPVLLTTFKLVWKFYEGKFDQLCWYQFGQEDKKSNAVTEHSLRRRSLFPTSRNTKWKPRRWTNRDLSELGTSGLSTVTVAETKAA